MKTARLEAFSDGVIAIIITIMVLEMKVPHSEHFSAVAKLWPVFASYVLSFAIVGVYWNNHHHMLHAAKKVNNRVLWTNLFLLFWLSLLPFTTGWMGENHFSKIPVALYAFNLFMAAVANEILQDQIIRCNGAKSTLAGAVVSRYRAYLAIAMQGVTVPLVLLGSPLIAGVSVLLLTCIWFVPEKYFRNLVKKPKVSV